MRSSNLLDWLIDVRLAFHPCRGARSNQNLSWLDKQACAFVRNQIFKMAKRKSSSFTSLDLWLSTNQNAGDRIVELITMKNNKEKVIYL